MSKLAEFRQLEKHLAEQLEALETLKGDAGLKKEIEFDADAYFAEQFGKIMKENHLA